MSVGSIDAAPQQHDPRLLDLRVTVAERTRFRCASRGEVLRVEIECNGLAAIVTQPDRGGLISVNRGGRKWWRLVSGLERICMGCTGPVQSEDRAAHRTKIIVGIFLIRISSTTYRYTDRSAQVSRFIIVWTFHASLPFVSRRRAGGFNC